MQNLIPLHINIQAKARYNANCLQNHPTKIDRAFIFGSIAKGTDTEFMHRIFDAPTISVLNLMLRSKT